MKIIKKTTQGQLWHCCIYIFNGTYIYRLWWWCLKIVLSLVFSLCLRFHVGSSVFLFKNYPSKVHRDRSRNRQFKRSKILMGLARRCVWWWWRETDNNNKWCFLNNNKTIPVYSWLLWMKFSNGPTAKKKKCI